MGATKAEPMTHAANVRNDLNRLISACSGELRALEAAIRVFGSDPRADQLKYYHRRRSSARTDLCAAVIGLGGAPKRSASLGSRLTSALRWIPSFAAGPNDGDTLSVVARASDTTELAYWKASSKVLPDHLRAFVARQYEEVQQDSRDLWRMRWGGSVPPAPSESPASPDSDQLAPPLLGEWVPTGA